MLGRLFLSIRNWPGTFHIYHMSIGTEGQIHPPDAARFSDPGHLHSLGRAHIDSQRFLCIDGSHSRKEARQTAFQARHVTSGCIATEHQAFVATR